MLKKTNEILANQALSRYVRDHLNGSSKDYRLPTKTKLISTTITLIGIEHKAQKFYFVKIHKGTPSINLQCQCYTSLCIDSCNLHLPLHPFYSNLTFFHIHTTRL
jgi:hypothetical protein